MFGICIIQLYAENIQRCLNACVLHGKNIGQGDRGAAGVKVFGSGVDGQGVLYAAVVFISDLQGFLFKHIDLLGDLYIDLVLFVFFLPLDLVGVEEFIKLDIAPTGICQLGLIAQHQLGIALLFEFSKVELIQPINVERNGLPIL